jgi:hypothetical protein
MKLLSRLLPIAICSFFSIACPAPIQAANIIEGEVIEFGGPDDLLLDPASALVAVDVFGNADSTINGVAFSTDRTGLGANATAEGQVTVDGVSVTTTRSGGGDIDNWAAAPAFVGADPASAANLAAVMRDIRWSLAPGATTIDIGGLNSGALYDIQLLFNEGADRNRFWDIGVEGELVVDNISSEGDDGTWTPNNSFAYQGQFDPGADGVLNIVMQQELGGDPPIPTDNNPILQAVIVHLAIPPTPFVITELDYDTATGESTITWNSFPGAIYALDFSKDLTPGSWIELDDGIDSQGEQTTFADGEPRFGRGFYRVRRL